MAVLGRRNREAGKIFDFLVISIVCLWLKSSIEAVALGKDQEVGRI